jgi:hypothetical protein
MTREGFDAQALPEGGAAIARKNLTTGSQSRPDVIDPHKVFVLGSTTSVPTWVIEGAFCAGHR